MPLPLLFCACEFEASKDSFQDCFFLPCQNLTPVNKQYMILKYLQQIYYPDLANIYFFKSMQDAA